MKLHSHEHIFISRIIPVSIATPAMNNLSENNASCAELLKVLADETRLAVVECLLERPMHVGELNESIQVEQSLLSHHLRVLREAGFVYSQRDGKAVLYCLAPRVEAMCEGKSINLGCCRLSFD